jgi:hypothetical protein
MHANVRAKLSGAVSGGGVWGNKMAAMGDYRHADFDVDLKKRVVTYRASGISFSFYTYTSEADWRSSDDTRYRDDPRWEGDRMAMAKAAKLAATAAGMTAFKE